jgi:hypothetical protein
MDNFEWSSGYTRRFGILYVDYATGRRIHKSSAHWYSRLVRDRGFVPLSRNPYRPDGDRPHPRRNGILPVRSGTTSQFMTVLK